MSDKIIKAKEFATNAHKNQMYGEHSYIYHLNMVAYILSKYHENIQIISYLHDILEDTNITKEELIKEFDQHIADCVELITDCSGKNRKERKLKTNEKLSKTNEFDALIVKVGDRTANVFNCIKDQNIQLFNMYKKEHSEFKKAVYRKGICDDIWEFLNLLINLPIDQFKGVFIL